MVQGPQKQYPQCLTCKYTNTQIQFQSKFHIGPKCGIYLKSQWYEDLKNNIPGYLTLVLMSSLTAMAI